jgi:hypothetical protein
MAGSANAAITDYFFYTSQSAQAYGVQANDLQTAFLPLSTENSFGNTVDAYATESGTLSDGSVYDSYAFATSSLGVNTQTAAGVLTGGFNGWGSYDTVSGLAMGANGFAEINIGFTITTPYAYTLEIIATPGSSAFAQFHDNYILLSDHAVEHPGGDNGLYIRQSGIFSGSFVNLVVKIHGDSIPNAQLPSGDFQYTLTLTPVPEPETWGLMLSGLGLVGWAARRRKHAAV